MTQSDHVTFHWGVTGLRLDVPISRLLPTFWRIPNSRTEELSMEGGWPQPEGAELPTFTKPGVALLLTSPSTFSSSQTNSAGFLVNNYSQCIFQ